MPKNLKPEVVYAFDSTTIDLCLNLFWWTNFLDSPDNILFDQTIRLTGQQTKGKYPVLLRHGGYYPMEHQRTFTYLTNNFEISAKHIARLYKNRWQVELFF